MRKFINYNFILLSLALIFKKFFVICQNGNSFVINTLESENSELIDVTDYHNLNLILTTGRKIYKGIPPQLLITTNAQIINTTSIITINENFLLASCLQNSLLSKINLNNGVITDLINYNSINGLNLEIPITSCSLSIIENTVFIGYTRIDFLETQVNKTNIIIKFFLSNLDSDEGPTIEINNEIKFFFIPESSLKLTPQDKFLVSLL